MVEEEQNQEIIEEKKKFIPEILEVVEEVDDQGSKVSKSFFINEDGDKECKVELVEESEEAKQFKIDFVVHNLREPMLDKRNYEELGLTVPQKLLDRIDELKSQLEGGE